MPARPPSNKYKFPTPSGPSFMQNESIKVQTNGHERPLSAQSPLSYPSLEPGLSINAITRYCEGYRTLASHQDRLYDGPSSISMHSTPPPHYSSKCSRPAGREIPPTPLESGIASISTRQPMPPIHFCSKGTHQQGIHGRGHFSTLIDYPVRPCVLVSFR